MSWLYFVGSRWTQNQIDTERGDVKCILSQMQHSLHTSFVSVECIPMVRAPLLLS